LDAEMSAYWAKRRAEALKKSARASTAESRAAYLRAAEHCRSLEEWSFAFLDRSGSAMAAATQYK
jgi:hypothetical protein